MRLSSMRLVLLCFSVPMLAACAATTQLSVQSGSMSHLSSECSALSSAPTARNKAVCTAAIYTQAGLRQRTQTGQLLALLTPAMPPENQRDVLRLALWLSPNIHIPEDAPALKKLVASLQKEEIYAEPFPNGALLRFEGAQSAGAWKGAVYDLPLRIPKLAQSAPLSRNELANIAASAAGGHAADAGDGWTPATAFSSSIMGMSFGALAPSPQSVESVRALQRADRALSKGAQGEAAYSFAYAQNKLPKDAPVCSVRAAISYVQGYLRFDVSLDADDAEEPDGSPCYENTTDPLERRFGVTLEKIDFLEGKHDFSSNEDQPTEWIKKDGFAAYSKELRAYTKELRPLPAERLLTLLKAAEIRTTYTHDPCSNEPLQRSNNALRGIQEELNALGRRDLASRQVHSLFVKRMQAKEAFTAQDARDTLAQVSAPEDAWRRFGFYNKTLYETVFLSSEINTAALTPLCTAYFDELQLRMQADTHPKFTDRNADRLFEAMMFEDSCPLHKKTLASIRKEIFTKALAEGEGTGILTLLSGGVGKAAQAIVSGQAQNLGPILKNVSEGIAEARALSEKEDQKSDKKRVLHSLFDATDALIRRIMGQEDDLPATLLQHAQSLETIAAKKLSKEAPMFARLAPVVRAGYFLLASGAQALEGDFSSALQTLNALDATLPRDLSRLYEVLETPDYTAPTLQIMRAIPKIAELAQSPTPSQQKIVETHLKTLQPAANESGGWSIGFGIARAVAWDAYALLTFEYDFATAQRAVQNASTPIAQTVQQALQDRQLEGTPWEALRIVSDLHTIAARMLLATSADQPLLTTLRTSLKETYPELSLSIKQGKTAIAREPEGRSSLVYALLDTVDVSLQLAVDPKTTEESFTPKLLENLKSSMKTYTPEAQLYLHVAFALNTVESDIESTMTSVRKAHTLIQKTYLRDYAFIPPIVAARFMMSGDTPQDPKYVLEALDLALKDGDRSLSCDKGHTVHAVLPSRAWTLKRMGRHDEADQALAQYLHLVDQGFAGDSNVECAFLSERSNVIATVTLKQSTFLPMESVDSGTLELNFGLQTTTENQERLTCSGTPLSTIREDRVMLAALTRAMYAWERGDDVKASKAVDRALYSAQFLVHALPGMVGPARAALLDESRKAALLTMVYWASTTARLRGFRWTASKLDEVYSDLSMLKEGSSDLEKIPRPLSGIQAFESISPLRGKDNALRKEVLASNLFKPWSTQLAAAFPGDLQDIARKIGKIRAPKNTPHAKAIVSLWSIALSKTIQPQEFQEAFDALAQTSPLEAILFGEVIANQHKNLAPAIQSIITKRFHNDKKQRASLSWLQSNTYFMRSMPRQIQDNAQHVVQDLAAIEGRIRPQDELQFHVKVLSALATAPATRTQAKDITRKTAQKLGRLQGPQSKDTLILETLYISFAILDDTLPEGTLANTLNKANSSPAEMGQIVTLLTKLRDGKNTEERKATAQEFIELYINSQ